MSNYYTGEIVAIPFPRPVEGWLLCDGALLQIDQHEELFEAIGTLYGGDGINTFAVPDLRARIIVCEGQLPGGERYFLGERGGYGRVGLTQNHLPPHRHPLYASTMAADALSPVNGFFATPTNDNGEFRGYLSKEYPLATDRPISPTVVAAAGIGVSHPNVMPTLALHYMICASGVFPNPY